MWIQQYISHIDKNSEYIHIYIIRTINYSVRVLMCVGVCMYACVYVCACVNVCAYMCAYVKVCMCVRIN